MLTKNKVEEFKEYAKRCIMQVDVPVVNNLAAMVISLAENLETLREHRKPYYQREKIKYLLKQKKGE